MATKKKAVVNKPELRFENAIMWFDRGIDIENRMISITGEIGEESVTMAIRAIYKMYELDDKAPIQIFINSYGGSVYDALALYDVMTCTPIPIITHAMGKVMSSGLTIFLGGMQRFAMPRTTFMAHEVSSGTYGKKHEIEADAQEVNRLSDQICSIFESRTSRTKAWWKKKIKFEDKYFGIDVAKKLGIVHGVYQEVEFEKETESEKK